MAQNNTHDQTFENRVAVCRKLLYHVNGAEETDEPPATTLKWKHACAIALGLKCDEEPKKIDKVS